MHSGGHATERPRAMRCPDEISSQSPITECFYFSMSPLDIILLSISSTASLDLLTSPPCHAWIHCEGGNSSISPFRLRGRAQILYILLLWCFPDSPLHRGALPSFHSLMLSRKDTFVEMLHLWLPLSSLSPLSWFLLVKSIASMAVFGMWDSCKFLTQPLQVWHCSCHSLI